MTFFDKVRNVLEKDRRFFTEDGVFLRNAAYEAAMEMDSSLIKLLYSDEETKQRFFTDINGISVFDKIEFGWFINNRQFIPDSFTRLKNKIGLSNKQCNLIDNNKIKLVFPYKDCILEADQTLGSLKRNEVFYNELLAPDEINHLLSPKAWVKARKYSITGVEENLDQFNEDENLIIKGNNLLVLSSLLPRYKGKVKLIYLDPPYYFKTSKATDTFTYNSNFHLSSWLNFMKDRLKLAKQFLEDEGTIWISIGEDGMHYLKVLADEIFGSENFIGTIPRRTRNGKSDVPFNFSQDFDWLLVYTKGSQK